MPDLQAAEPNQKLLRQYALSRAPALHLAEELVPVVVVDNLSGADVANEGYPRDCSATLTVVAGGAGNLSVASWLPTNNVLCQLTGIVMFDLVGTKNFVIRNTAAATVLGLTEVFTKGFNDTRVTPALPNCFIGSRNNTAVPDGTAVMNVVGAIDESIYLPVNFTGFNGGGVQVHHGTLNAALRVGFFWTEYLITQR